MAIHTGPKFVTRLYCLLFSAVLGLTVASCTERGASQNATRPGEWTQFRLNPQHNAVLPGSLRVSWSIKTDGGFSSSPAILGGALYIGNNKGELFSIDVRTGHVRWAYHTSGPLMSNPLIYHGLIIVGEGNESKMEHPFRLGTSQNRLLAVDSRDGVQRWALSLPGSGMPTPAIIDGLLVQHNGGRTIVGLSPQKGDIRYTVEAGTTAAMSAIVPSSDQTFLTAGSADSVVQKRRVADAALVWSTTITPGWGVSDCPLASDGHLILCDYIAPTHSGPASYHPGDPGIEHAYALSERDGHPVWNIPLESGFYPERNLAAIPLIVGRTVYLGSSLSPYMHALDTETGKFRWRLRVHGAVKGGIAEEANMLYFGDLGGYLWAVDATSGKVTGSRNMHTPFNVGSPVIVGKTLIIGSKTGAVIAIPLKLIRESHNA